jgi:hypothetical protein
VTGTAVLALAVLAVAGLAAGGLGTAVFWETPCGAGAWDLLISFSSQKN